MYILFKHNSYVDKLNMRWWEWKKNVLKKMELHKNTGSCSILQPFERHIFASRL